MLVAAKELGLYEKYGLVVKLSREVGWAAIREKLLLMQEPELVMLDEPVAGMSPAERDQTAELLRRICKGRSLIIIEHEASRESLDAGKKWSFTGIFSKPNGGGFLTEHYPEARKAGWKFGGIHASSRHIPGVEIRMPFGQPGWMCWRNLSMNLKAEKCRQENQNQYFCLHVSA